MAKGKNKIVVSGVHALIQEIERLGGKTEEALVEAIETSGRNATNRYVKVIKEHKLTGLTEDSIVMNPKAEVKGNLITLSTGFDISKGGVAAIWLDRGTPKQRPLNFIRKIKNDGAVKGSIGYVLGEEWRKLNR